MEGLLTAGVGVLVLVAVAGEGLIALVVALNKHPGHMPPIAVMVSM